VSWGELIDKLTILEIKEHRLTSPTALSNVRRELAGLKRIISKLQRDRPAMNVLRSKLRAVNETLWDIENQIRAKEVSKAFDSEFIELARSIYLNNDKRAEIKRRISELLNSELIEEKQYTPYAP
jgi:hypothetical protein